MHGSLSIWYFWQQDIQHVRSVLQGVCRVPGPPALYAMSPCALLAQRGVCGGVSQVLFLLSTTYIWSFTITVHLFISTLHASSPAGFLRVGYASPVTHTVHPAGGNPLTVWAVRHSTCCWITHADYSVLRAFTLQRGSVTAVQITVHSAPRMACATVSTDVERMIKGEGLLWEDNWSMGIEEHTHTQIRVKTQPAVITL